MSCVRRLRTTAARCRGRVGVKGGSIRSLEFVFCNLATRRPSLPSQQLQSSPPSMSSRSFAGALLTWPGFTSGSHKVVRGSESPRAAADVSCSDCAQNRGKNNTTVVRVRPTDCQCSRKSVLAINEGEMQPQTRKAAGFSDEFCLLGLQNYAIPSGCSGTPHEPRSLELSPKKSQSVIK